MINLNWRLLFVLVLVALGVYLLLAFRAAPQLTNEQQDCYRSKRYIGIALIIVGVVLCVYFWYTGQIKFRATMNNDCKVCQIYINRKRALRPYSTGEYNQLVKHAGACDTCSKMCSDLVGVMQRDPTATELEKKRRTESCIDITQNAILAKKDLERLHSQRARELGPKVFEAWKIAQATGARPTWDPFPKIPK